MATEGGGVKARFGRIEQAIVETNNKIDRLTKQQDENPTPAREEQIEMLSEKLTKLEEALHETRNKKHESKEASFGILGEIFDSINEFIFGPEETDAKIEAPNENKKETESRTDADSSPTG